MTAPVTWPLTALRVYDAALAAAGTGSSAVLMVRHVTGAEQRIDPALWCRPELPGDSRLLDSCSGPTLDVGCGPGRLTYALNQRGHAALGIDVSAEAVRLARARGATALRRDVFSALPGQGRWRHILLADGNVGIGGDPVRLLRRCRDLLAADGRLHVELGAPGTPTWSGQVQLSIGDGPPSDGFAWAALAAGDLPAVAAAAALHVVETWTEADRWFATLSPA
uniref:class I SAM-dependent methyltransferase n=1 Tax=Paractinoplanes polyasparticus TaxID=2856853 RepID=UPI001C85B839|nr:class I SAM-dependent methyltransferase [Actinoplanes polyasparticus]